VEAISFANQSVLLILDVPAGGRKPLMSHRAHEQ
jgi:hypothetical protein